MLGGVSLWIPVISAVGSLGIGALVGAFGAEKLRERGEREREKRERDGLLRLVLIEMLHNQPILYRTYADLSKIPPESEDAVFAALARIDGFRTDTWESVRVRLVQLLPSEDLDPLATHYGDLQDALALLQGYRQGANDPVGNIREPMLRALDRTERSRMKANKIGVKYLGRVAQNDLQPFWIQTSP